MMTHPAVVCLVLALVVLVATLLEQRTRVFKGAGLYTLGYGNTILYMFLYSACPPSLVR